MSEFSKALTPPEWMRDGLCGQTDPELFYPEKGESSAPAKKTCRVCPVQRRCLGYALRTEQQWGIWGGMSARELRKLRGDRRKDKAA